MRKLFRKTALASAVRRASNTPPPRRWYLGDDENDFLFVKIEDSEKLFRFVVKKDMKSHIEGIAWSKDQNIGYDSCLLSTISASDTLEIFRVYKSVKLDYASLLHFYFLELIGYKYFAYLSERAKNENFRRKFKFSRKRLEILLRIVEWRRNKLGNTATLGALEKEAFSHIEVAQMMYGKYFWSLQDHDKYLEETLFILRSLVETGDLAEKNLRFQLKPAALVKLEEQEEQERKHFEIGKQNTRIFWLTSIIALAALGQLLKEILC